MYYCLYELRCWPMHRRRWRTEVLLRWNRIITTRQTWRFLANRITNGGDSETRSTAVVDDGRSQLRCDIIIYHLDSGSLPVSQSRGGETRRTPYRHSPFQWRRTEYKILNNNDIIPKQVSDNDLSTSGGRHRQLSFKCCPTDRWRYKYVFVLCILVLLLYIA